MKQESAISDMLVIVGGILVAVYPFLIQAKDYVSQKFQEISGVVNNFISYVNANRVTAFLLVLLGLVAVYFIYKIIKALNNKIEKRKEEARNLKYESKEIEKILKKRLNFDYEELINFIEQIEDKIGVADTINELSVYLKPLKEKLEKASSFLECLEYEKRVNSLSQKERELNNNLETLEQEMLTSKTQYPENPQPKKTENKIREGQKAYLKKELREAELRFLETSGFKEVMQTGISGKKEAYLVIEDKYESPGHIVCIKEIVDYLKQFTQDIQTYRTVMPDIVFNENGNKYAIEIETGTIIRDKKKMQNKIDLLKKKFGKNWFFFVTNRNLEKKYSKFGETYSKRNIKIKIDKLFRKSEK